MKASNIAQAWATFEQRVLQDLKDQPTGLFRDIFYAGSLAAWEIVKRAVNVESEDAANSAFSRMDAEFDAYVSNMTAENDAQATTTTAAAPAPTPIPAIKLRHTQVVNLPGEELVTQAPTLTNPQALHTVDELRAELQRANTLLSAHTETLHQLRHTVQSLASDMAPIMLAHIRTDPDALVQALNTFVAAHLRVVATHSGSSAAKAVLQ